MSKSAGLSQRHKKMLEYFPFKKDSNPAALLYDRARSFYCVFKQSFGQGYETILGHDIPKTTNIGPCLTNYHFAVECMLKALLCLRLGHLRDEHESHHIGDLIEEVEMLYPELSKIVDCKEHMLLLNELGSNFSGIRYGEYPLGERA